MDSYMVFPKDPVTLILACWMGSVLLSVLLLFSFYSELASLF